MLIVIASALSINSCSTKDGKVLSLAAIKQARYMLLRASGMNFIISFRRIQRATGCPRNTVGKTVESHSVYSVNPENGYGYTEETKPMLNTSYGFVPWDDSHHSELCLGDT